jgi:hypothetical protein
MQTIQVLALPPLKLMDVAIIFNLIELMPLFPVTTWKQRKRLRGLLRESAWLLLMSASFWELLAAICRFHMLLMSWYGWPHIIYLFKSNKNLNRYFILAT